MQVKQAKFGQVKAAYYVIYVARSWGAKEVSGDTCRFIQRTKVGSSAIFVNDLILEKITS